MLLNIADRIEPLSESVVDDDDDDDVNVTPLLFLLMFILSDKEDNELMAYADHDESR